MVERIWGMVRSWFQGAWLKPWYLRRELVLALATQVAHVSQRRRDVGRPIHRGHSVLERPVIYSKLPSLR